MNWPYARRRKETLATVGTQELNINFYSSFPSVRYLVAYGEKSIKSFQIKQIFYNKFTLSMMPVYGALC